MTMTERFDAEFLASATGGTLVGAPAGNRVATDSRRDVTGALFVALVGPNFDGHRFVTGALAAGATGAVVDASFRAAHPDPALPLCVVPDTLAALQALARAHRERFPVPLAAITGSTGKTTTKEILAAALTPLGPVLKTAGNRNNHLGVPLTLLELTPEHRGAVVEMGMNAPREIARLSRLARPRVAVITNVTAAHLEGVGNRAGVARAKAEILEGLDPEGVLVHPFGDEDLEAALTACPVRRVRFGFDSRAEVHPRSLDRLPDGGHRLELPKERSGPRPSPAVTWC